LRRSQSAATRLLIRREESMQAPAHCQDESERSARTRHRHDRCRWRRQVDILRHDPEAMDIGVTRCRFAEFFRALGEPEPGAQHYYKGRGICWL
jgi:hypothetical protein